MQLKISKNSFFIFDLDDTLFQELDFLKSAYSCISTKLAASIGFEIYEEMLARYANKENVFNWVIDQHQQSCPYLSMDWLLKEYREHYPSIQLSKETSDFLDKIKSLSIPAGLITDGRSITQRNKLKAMKLENYFSDVIISEEFGSEKPDERNFYYFKNKYPKKNFIFFGDNTSKDFIVPSKLGWTTFCIKDSGNHIHSQVLDINPMPDYIVSSFREIQLIPA